jgi:SAM-dependent methyltransferase
MSNSWSDGGAYEAYVGRWSRQVAPLFVRWLDAPAGGRWLDVGCGTGALTEAILAAVTSDDGDSAGGPQPTMVFGIDPSTGFLTAARGLDRVAFPAARGLDRAAFAAARRPDRAAFAAGDARALPVRNGALDVVVSGLSLNFVPDPAQAVAEYARVAAPGALVAAYVWDYAGGMEMMRLFWDAAATVDPSVADKDEAARFPICHPDALRAAWTTAGLHDVRTDGIEIRTGFADFDDFWRPFLGRQGAAPAYLATLNGDDQSRIREELRSRLPGGPIDLRARAWAVRGQR